MKRAESANAAGQYSLAGDADLAAVLARRMAGPAVTLNSKVSGRTQLHSVDDIGLVNDLAHDCGPSAPDYNVVGAPVAGSFVVADDVELVEGVPESVNESTWS